MNKNKAIELLKANVKNENLVRHNLAVGYSLGSIYDYLKANNWKNDSPDSKDTWEILGFVHDSDWELTKDDITKHTLMTLDWLKSEGVLETDPLYLAISSHNTKRTNLKDVESQMEWALECVDELTGFVVAVAMVKGKLLANVEVSSVIKRFKEKAFAAAVHREQITQVAEKLEIPIEKFVEITLTTMQNHSNELGM